MSIESAVTFFFAIVIFGVTPGPGTFAIIAKAMTQNARATYPLSLGMTASDLLYFGLACFGLAAIAERWETLFTAIRFIGAAYLLYLGYKMWTSAIELDQIPSRLSKGEGVKSFCQGFLISASNPKVILFYIAFLPTFMDLTTLQANDIGLAVTLVFFGLMLGLVAIAHMANAASAYFSSPRAMRNLNRSAGSIMMIAAAFLATRG